MNTEIPNERQGHVRRDEAETNQEPSSASHEPPCSGSPLIALATPSDGSETEAFQLDSWEVEYDGNHAIPLRESALQTLAYMIEVEHGWATPTKESDSHSPKLQALLSATHESWIAAGRPTGEKWVEVFAELLHRESRSTQPRWVA